MKKASRLRSRVHLPDLSPAIGTCLRKTFEKETAYQGFTKLLSAFKSKGVNQSFPYLLPPTQGTKVRFMNLARPVKWAAKMLARLDQLSGKEAVFFSALTEQTAIIKSLETCLSWSTSFAQPLKKEGLSESRLAQMRKKLAAFVEEKKKTKASLVVRFLNLLDTYLTAYQSFVKEHKGKNIPVSSEVIESLFGKYKQVASKNKLTVTTRLNLQIPVQCMSMEAIRKKTKNALETIFMSDIDHWTQMHSSENQIVKRRRFFND